MVVGGGLPMSDEIDLNIAMTAKDIKALEEKLKNDKRKFLEEQICIVNKAIGEIKQIARIYSSDEDICSMVQGLELDSDGRTVTCIMSND